MGGCSLLLKHDSNRPLLSRLCSLRAVQIWILGLLFPWEVVNAFDNPELDVVARHSCNNVQFLGCRGNLVDHLCVLQCTRAIPLKIWQWSFIGSGTEEGIGAALGVAIGLIWRVFMGVEGKVIGVEVPAAGRGRGLKTAAPMVSPASADAF